ncbi:hypothetical protein AMECASPLE_028918 [Ameca splendens]|uniref:Uncharacterized protein n=1 Tax=Ameca splendens TaxID=208324 RepID=A0ABV1AF60_9TELE
MPSINMKLEMVTIIACEVDTEVFTSDKMQTRIFINGIRSFPRRTDAAPPAQLKVRNATTGTALWGRCRR